MIYPNRFRPKSHSISTTGPNPVNSRTPYVSNKAQITATTVIPIKQNTNQLSQYEISLTPIDCETSFVLFCFSLTIQDVNLYIGIKKTRIMNRGNSSSATKRNQSTTIGFECIGLTIDTIMASGFCVSFCSTRFAHQFCIRLNPYRVQCLQLSKSSAVENSSKGGFFWFGIF